MVFLLLGMMHCVFEFSFTCFKLTLRFLFFFKLSTVFVKWSEKMVYILDLLLPP